jgi:insulysin
LDSFKIGRINFSFKDKENPISYVSYLASTMQIYDINDILAAEYFMLEYSPNTIEKLLSYLTPEKMKITVVSKKYKPITDRIEKWYGTEYNIKFLKKVTLQKFN